MYSKNRLVLISFSLILFSILLSSAGVFTKNSFYGLEKFIKIKMNNKPQSYTFYYKKSKNYIEIYRAVEFKTEEPGDLKKYSFYYEKDGEEKEFFGGLELEK